MCLTLSPIVGLHQWNWEGDHILHECIVPSGRPAIGYSGKRYEYPIDVREFLVTERNEVMRRALNEDLLGFAKKNGVRTDFLQSRAPGNFDLRVAMVTAFVSQQVAYRPVRGNDYWQFPDETLFLKGGDCEDRALLIAALLIAAGVSAYNVRVAIGQVHVQPARGAMRKHDHAWVVYKNEAGRWQILEPLLARRHEVRAPTKVRIGGLSQDVRRAEYVPYYLFNNVHLWKVAQGDPVPTLGELAQLRRRWKRLHPKFAGQVHQNILTEALSVPQCPRWFLESITSHFSTLFGNVIDERDNFITHGYDSRDHFDNAYIDEGWARVRDRLSRFQVDNEGNIDAFSGAAHAIADFYAHTSYAHFADNGSHSIPICEPEKPLVGLSTIPNYAGGDFDLAGGPFTVASSWKKGKAEAAAAWKGKIISGRYALPGDSQDILERLVPTPSDLREPGHRAALPHHNEIAVDGDKSNNKLYQPVGEYQRQFVMRKGAAVEHIRQAFIANWKS